MQCIADLQLHSKYSRAVSSAMTIPGIYGWAKRKGIHVVATGDWTHPLWMKEIQEHLEEIGNGLLRLRKETGKKSQESGGRGQETKFPVEPLFLLATEVSSIFSQGGKGRRIHTLIWVPSIDSALKINKEMTKQGCNLLSDGRPIIGLSSMQVAELVLTIEPKALIIPAHAWTPWFGAYGSMSGFDSLKEEFGPYADQIYAIETGLSSNPAMNWQIEELDQRSIVSFSDAHSGPKLGREATVFEIDEHVLSNRNPGLIAYDDIYQAITRANRHTQIAYTIEFYPEEGKYHYTGHRACNIRLRPEETKAKGGVCPVCGKPLTQGVMQRVEQLATRTEKDISVEARQKNTALHLQEDITAYYSATFSDRPPYIMLVPLQEIIAECVDTSVTSKKTMALYEKITDHFGGEFAVLLHASFNDIAAIAGERIAVGITKVRTGDIVIDPGYDGVFGVVKLWKQGEQRPAMDTTKEQLSMF